MDVNLELVKRIISSDELCDKVNSGDNRKVYVKQIQNYVLNLIGVNVNSNMEYIIRYLKKFVLNSSNEDIFFDEVLLKLYSLNIKNSDFLSILNSFDYVNVKQSLMKKYSEIIGNRRSVSSDELVKMLSLYCYTYSDFSFSIDYLNYFVYYLSSLNVVLSYDLISYFYKQFALGFAKSKDINTTFVILDDVVSFDPYYDNVKNKIVLYRSNIGNSIDPMVLADIFYQITYLYILKGINDVDNRVYTYDQLKLVKELCLMSILGNEFYDINYDDISYSTYLKRQSMDTVSNYYSKLGLSFSYENNFAHPIKLDEKLDDDADKKISIDILFDMVLKNENPNLITSLIRNYPILGSEYKNNKKKSLLTLILDIYDNKRLLVNLNKDLEWYKKKKSDDLIIKSTIEKLNKKISICNSYIGVLNSIIMNGDLTSYDLLRSISDLITYNHSNKFVRNDIYLVLSNVIPKKIKRLCCDRSDFYKENLKKKIIKCYLDSLDLVKSNSDVSYFMKIYSTLEFCIASFDVD